ncbi:hypothetical protein MSG28_010384 [Choristoneura fumiferana]|uniref:Uncharacterized protein n=1 Tax=Choristoneura fumiferana TaxID=7141 RepID=A0ACC0KKB3_CHOFU|nr:hypothetical protein MSG28_010384 [Choristoneura fumiferana]
MSVEVPCACSSPEDCAPTTTPRGISLGSSPELGPSLKEYEDEPDETLSERLWGLTEMFPVCIRNGTYTITTKSWSGAKSLYSLSRSVMWIVASSSVILFAPVIFEVERAQVLLGTNAALSGPMPNMPPMPR